MREMALTFYRESRLSITERAGGWVLAVCLHVILFAGLVVVKPIAAVQPAAQTTIEITFAPEAPQADPAAPLNQANQIAVVSSSERIPEPAASLPDQGTEDGRDLVNASPEASTKLGEDPSGNQANAPTDAAMDKAVEDFLAGKTDNAADAEAPSAAPPADSIPATTNDPSQPAAGDSDLTGDPELVQTFRARSEAMNKQNAEARASGSKEVAARIMKAHATQVANKTLFASDPMRNGTVRTVETSNVPNKIADEVLSRWGFRVQVMAVGPVKGGGNYLSGVQAGGSSFVNATADPGVYRVLLFGDDTVRRLVKLEDEEMQRNHYDPAKVRVTRVVFGIVSSGSQYDLAVTKMEVEPLKQPAPTPDANAEALVKRVQ